jgi:predicted DsbA family dithiol-disulfide isomerase
LKRNFGLKVKFTNFPLHPETPEEGRSLAELFGGRNADREARHRRMKSLMDQEGLPYGERTMTYNSRLAQELGKWAEDKPGGDRIHDAVFRAYFVDNINIAKPEVLLKLVEQVGLPVTEAHKVLETSSFKDAVDADWKRCLGLGITGVPTFFLDGFMIVGAHPYEELERFVMKASRGVSPEL